MVARRLLIAFFVLGLCGVAAAADLEIPDIEFEFYTLENGLEVILHEDHSTPIVGVNLWYHVGSKNERVGRSGFAHLFEHMMFQGSAHQDAEFLSTIQGFGGGINGSTSEDRTNYWELVPPERLEATLLLEADRLGWLLPAMTEEKFENQKDVVRNERRQSEGRPYSVFWLNMNEMLYPKGHPYDHSVIGIHEDLENASLDDVKDFFRRYYTPTNATLSIAGDIDPAQTKAWIEKYFGAIPPGEPVQEMAVWIPEMTSERRVSLQDRVELPRIYWVWHTAPQYRDGDADLDLACNILGGGNTSRLYRRLIHEEGLAQDVSFRQTSQQLVSQGMLSVTLAPGADQTAVERIVQEELDKFRTAGPTARELERVKNAYAATFIKGIQRVGSWGGINDRLNRYNHYVGTPDYFRQDYERYSSRTRQTVQAAFTKWIGPGRMVFEVRPFGEVKAMAEADAPDRGTLPLPEADPTFVAAPLQRGSLPNGLKIVVLPQDELPLVRAELVFHSGTGRDPEGREGLADVTSSMLLEGTKKRDKFEFKDEMDFLGTDVWTGTNAERTVLGIQALAPRIDESMALMAEALLQPAFPAKEFQVDKQRRIVDIRRESEQATTVARKVAARIMYGDDHPYGRLGSGTPETMGAITLDDVRSFAGTHFVPANATLVVAGDVTLPEAEALAARHLGAWSGDAPPPVAVAKPEPRTERVVYLVDKPGDSQSTIRIAQFGIPRDHEDWVPVDVMNRMLAGGFSSRLNLNLREDKGYSYGVRGATGEASGTSLYTLGGRVQREVTAPALVEFISEYEDGRGKRPFTEEELQFAKNTVALGYAQRFETIGQLAGAVSDQVTYGLPDDDYATYPGRVAAVDLATAQEIARDYLTPGTAAIVVVGDLERIEDSIRELDLGPIRFCDREGNLMDMATDVSSR
jgi:zinc protease